MGLDVGLAATLIGCAIGLCTFFLGRQTSAKTTGAEWGELKTDLRYIKQNIADIKLSMGDNIDDLRTAIEKEEAERRESVRRLHARIDELAPR